MAAQAADEAGGGLLWAGGVGAGWARVSCAICGRARDFGPTAQLRLSTRLSPRLIVGGEAMAWTHAIPEEDPRQYEGRHYIGALQGIAYLYPRPRGDLYVKGGIGWVTYRVDEHALNGVGMQLGAGYELALGGGLALDNSIGLVASSFASLERDGSTVASDVSVTLLRFGVGLKRR